MNLLRSKILFVPRSMYYFLIFKPGTWTLEPRTFNPMKNIISLIICILSSSFISIPAQEINILTYNIRYASFDNAPQSWDLRKEGVISLLKGRDFIGLQEVVPVQMSDIMKSTSDEYDVLFRTREANESVGEGSPVLYNKTRWKMISSGYFWLSDTPEIPGSNTWGAACNRMVSFGFFQEINSEDSILVINTHFDHISQSAREKSIDLILEKFKKTAGVMPVVFMGDLNVSPENQVYKNIISGLVFSDSYRAIHPTESQLDATFHGWKPEPPVNRIDYIFTSAFLTTLSSEILHDKYKENYPSDHFPLNTILIIKK